MAPLGVEPRSLAAANFKSAVFANFTTGPSLKFNLSRTHPLPAAQGRGSDVPGRPASARS